MEQELSRLDKVLVKVQSLLQGEPLRVIVYVGAILIYLIAKLVKVIPDQSLDQAITSAGSASVVLVGLVETARKLTSSPKTVERITDAALQAALAQVYEAYAKTFSDAKAQPEDTMLGQGEPVAAPETVPDGDARIEALPVDESTIADDETIDAAQADGDTV